MVTTSVDLQTVTIDDPQIHYPKRGYGSVPLIPPQWARRRTPTLTYPVQWFAGELRRSNVNGGLFH